MSTQRKKIEPIFDDNINGVLVAAVWNLKKVDAKNFQPISIRVTANRERWYHQTGFRVSFEDYELIRNATGIKNPSAKAKASIKQSFDDVCAVVRKLIREEEFSLENLAEAMKLPIKRNVGFSLLDYWTTFGDGKNAEKTREQYRCAARSFYRALGCEVVSVKDAFGDGFVAF